MDKKIIIIIVIAIILAAVLIAGYFLWVNFKKPKAENFGGSAEDITNSATKGVLPSLQTNPLEDKPDLNPADRANPFANIKTNPF